MCGPIMETYTYHSLEAGLAFSVALSSRNGKTASSAPRCRKFDDLVSSSPIISDCLTLPRRKKVRFSTTEENQPPKPSSPLMVVAAQDVPAMRMTVNDLYPQQQEEEDEESYSLWYNKSDLRGFLHGAIELANSCNDNIYLDHLEGAYTSCFMEQGPQSTMSDHYAQELALIAAADVSCCSISNINNNNSSSNRNATTMEQQQEQYECTRGLERLTSPLVVGSTTKHRRRMTIQTVVLAQDVIRRKEILIPTSSSNERYDDELLRLLSEEHSGPAKKFAKALGTVDAISALVEYSR